VALCVVLAGLVVLARAAAAASFSGTVRGTGGIGLNVRAASSSGAARVGGLSEGTTVVIDFYGHGDTVTGY
jgi:hypothetical protein